MALFLSLIFSTTSILAISPECLAGWTNIYNSQTNLSLFGSEYFFMYQYSGFNYNNLGNYNGCNKIGIARYVVILISPTILQTVCGPISCTKEDYYTTPFPFYKSPSFEIFFPHKYQKDHYDHYSTGAIVMIVFMVLISFTVLVFTGIDFLMKGEIRKRIYFQVVLSFSLISNVSKVFTTRSQDRLGEKDSLEILNSVRVFSIGWVILGHTLLNYIGLPLTNIFDLGSEFKDQQYTIVYAAFFAVDTFFWMSGLLMTYLFIIEFDKTPGIPIMKLILVYVHRFLRITPVYMFCLLFWWSLQPYMGNGPMWVEITDRFNDDCDDHWYTNLLYVNNFVPNWKTSSCLGQSWYLANDMQFFIISPIILIIYLKVFKQFAWICVVAFNILGIVTAGTIAHHFNLNPVILSSDNKENYFNYYYTKPYCRIPPYIIGVACGLILYSYRQNKKSGVVYDRIALFLGKSLDNQIIRYITFAIGLFIINFLIFIQYNTYRHPGDGEYHHWSNNQKYAFIALERVFFGIGLSFVLMPMILGYFTFAANIMSAYIWSVMARFTFVMYLMHYAIIETALFSSKTNVEFNQYNNIRDAFYFFFLAFVCSIPIVLGIEMPSGNLEKLLFSFARKRPSEDEKSNNVSLIGINPTEHKKQLIS